MKIAFVALILSILAPMLASAENAGPVVAVLPFSSAGVGEDETKTVENLVESYVSEVDEFRLVAAADRDLVLSEWEFAVSGGTVDPEGAEKLGSLLAADYLLTGNIGTVGENSVLTLDFVKVDTGEKRSVSAIHPSMSDLVLDARSLVRRLFDKELAAENRAEDAGVAELTEDSVVGTWQGDKGTEIVRVLRGGKAIAILSSGAKMELSYTIDGDTLVVRQASSNTERFYHPVPYKVAVQLVSLADPMEWRLKLAAKGIALRGTKTSTAVSYENDTILEVTKNAVREAEWTRFVK